MAEQKYGGESFIRVALLLVLILLISGGIAYGAYTHFSKGGLKKPGATPPEPGDNTSSGGIGGIAGAAKRLGSKLFGTPESSATTSDKPDTIRASSYFPLKRVYGADLHKTSDFVKDLQQYLNKFRGARLDIDGAFGDDTERAVMAAWGGAKEISVDDYNNIIAPKLGKSRVV